MGRMAQATFCMAKVWCHPYDNKCRMIFERVTIMLMPGAEGHFWQGTRKEGVLLIHGFTGSPSELRELGEILVKKGYTVMGLRLAGHGTTPEDLEGVTYTDWQDQVVDAVNLLRETCDRVTLIGLSMGGLLALYAGAVCAVDRLVVLATPIYLFDWRVHFLWLADKLPYKAIPKRRRHVDAPARYDVAYRCMPIAGVHELKKLLSDVKHLWLPQVEAPILIIQSLADRTVRPESAQYIFDTVASEEKKLLWLPQSRHVLTLYEGRELLYQEIQKFLEE